MYRIIYFISIFLSILCINSCHSSSSSVWLYNISCINILAFFEYCLVRIHRSYKVEQIWFYSKHFMFLYAYFTMALEVSLSMVMAPPFKEVTALYITEQTRINMSAMVCTHFGVVKISRHYGAGHGSVPCRPLFRGRAHKVQK